MKDSIAKLKGVGNMKSQNTCSKDYCEKKKNKPVIKIEKKPVRGI